MTGQKNQGREIRGQESVRTGHQSLRQAKKYQGRKIKQVNEVSDSPKSNKKGRLRTGEVKNKARKLQTGQKVPKKEDTRQERLRTS